MHDTQQWKYDPVLNRLTYCWCSYCVCNLPLNPRRGYCAWCADNECWKTTPNWAACGAKHGSHAQCQEYFDSIVNEMATQPLQPNWQQASGLSPDKYGFESLQRHHMSIQLDSVLALGQLLMVLAVSGWLLWYTRETYRLQRKEEIERTLKLFEDDQS